MNTKRRQAFADFIESEYDNFSETKYGNWWYGNNHFSGFKESIKSVLEEWSQCSGMSRFDEWLNEYGYVFYSDEKIMNLYLDGILQVNDEEALEYIEESNPSEEEIVNYLVNGSFSDNERFINDYGDAYIYADTNGDWLSVIDINKSMETLSKHIDILVVGDLWFFDFDTGYGNLMDDEKDKDLFEEDFHDALFDACANGDVLAEEIPALDDKIGDTTQLIKRIDYDNRDYAAIYLGDGNFIIGEDSGKSHTEILNKWLKEHGKEESGEQWYRLDTEDVQNLTNATSIAFCHIIGDCVFVDVDSSEMLDCTPEEVVHAAIKNYGYAKGYAYSPEDLDITRIAKKYLVTPDIARLYQILGKRVKVRQIR